MRDPLLRLIQAFGPKLPRIGAHIVADARPVGGPRSRLPRGPRVARGTRPHDLPALLGSRDGGATKGLPARRAPHAIRDGHSRAPVVASTQYRPTTIRGYPLTAPVRAVT